MLPFNNLARVFHIPQQIRYLSKMPEKKKIQLVFDFDQTISAYDTCAWLVKYFSVFNGCIPEYIESEYKNPHVPYDQFMNDVFREYKTHKRPTSMLKEHMTNMPLIEGYAELFKTVHKLSEELQEESPFVPQILVTSDSFVPLIQSVLRGNGLGHLVGKNENGLDGFIKVIAHPCEDLAVFDEQGKPVMTSLKYREKEAVTFWKSYPLMDQHECEDCPRRLCKYVAVKDLIPFLGEKKLNTSGKLQSDYKLHSVAQNYNDATVVYVGDGRNDFCAAKALRECDLLLPKVGTVLASLSKNRSDELNCSVHEWRNAVDIIGIVEKEVLGDEIDGFGKKGGDGKK